MNGVHLTSSEPIPHYFGDADAPLFGWLHPDSMGQQADVGLVVCSPFGFEEVCAHRSVKHMAEAFSSAGIPTLRFDYAGCGDSAGDEFEPNILSGWVDSIHQAIDHLKRASGVRSVFLLGVRLGATLASVAAVDRTDVSGLISIAPVVRGRSYVRELLVLGQTGLAASAGGGTKEEVLEAAGFVMTQETRGAVTALDLRTLPRPPAKNILLIERDDVPAAQDWLPSLQSFDVSVVSRNWPGYRDMMTDPQRAKYPAEMMTGILSEIQKWRECLSQNRTTMLEPEHSLPVLPQSAVWGSLRFKESVAQINTGTSKLYGILTQLSDQTVASAKRVGVVMINSGSVHHIGPNRLWVQLSRRWAEHGLIVLRLDLSGVGDSPSREGTQDNVVYSAEARHDIALALSFMRELVGQEGECHLMGLCSGAYHTFKAAVAGEIMTSALMINPLTFNWIVGTPLNDVIKDYEVISLSSKYRRNLLSKEPWMKLVRGQLDFKYIFGVAVRRVWAFVQPAVAEIARIVGIPLRDDIAADLKAIAARGVPQHYVFAIGDPGEVLLRRQSGRILNKLIAGEQLSICRIPDADHTFTRLDARERLIATLDQYMLR